VNVLGLNRVARATPKRALLNPGRPPLDGLLKTIGERDCGLPTRRGLKASGIGDQRADLGFFGSDAGFFSDNGFEIGRAHV